MDQFCFSIRMDQRLTTSDITDPVAKTHAKANEMSYQVNRTLLTALSSKYPHLLEAQLDFEPRIEAFWFCGGINPPPCVVRAKESIRWLKPYAHKPVQIPVQYLGKPILQLRHNHPLKEIIPFDDLENRNLNVPEFKLDPRTLGYYFRRRHATNIPGFWPGDKAEFGVLSYHSSEYLEHRPKTFNDDFDALATQAILASYGNLLSQSCYQGFSTFHDVTYPLVSQMVITNGQWWTFCVYQLNTVLLHSEYVVNNPRSNICWMTKPMKLFEKVEEGKVCGLEDEVLKRLIKFYINVPEQRMGVELKPYLGKKEKVIAHIRHNARREWLEKSYKHLVSNRPRHRRIPEIAQWQKIYMIDNKTRPIEKRRDPWQFGIKPMQRRLDDHALPYIPRCLRKLPKKRKLGRHSRCYYP